MNTQLDVKSRANRGFSAVTVLRTKVTHRITKGACPWDIYSLADADEMFNR